MALLPELERIEVDTPPSSPLLFADSLDTRTIQEVASPTKRVRLSTGKFGPSKRRKKGTVHSSRWEPDGVAPRPYSNNEEYLQVSEVSADEYTVYVAAEYPQVSEVSADGYTAYVAAVSQRLAGFYLLSDELYVVQGWDNKSNYVKVNFGFSPID